MPHWYRRTWCGCSRAVTPCLSSCCYHDIVISVNFAKSLKFRDCRGFTSLASGSFHTPGHCDSLVVVQNILDEPPKVLWRRTCRVQVLCHVVEGSGLLKLSRGFLFSSSPCPRLRCPLPDPLSSGLSQSSPSSGTPHGFPYGGSLLRWWVGSTAGAAILYLLSSTDVGGLPSICLSVDRLSLRPSPNKNPAFLWQWRVPSGLPAS